jgi:hypothetical protein
VEEEGDEWEEFQASFDALNLSEAQTVQQLSEQQIKALRQELIASLMTMYHESQARPSVDMASQGRVTSDDSPDATYSVPLNSAHLSFDKLNSLEADIDEILENEEYFTALKSSYISTQSSKSLQPQSQPYSTTSGSSDLMKQLMSRHFNELQRYNVGTVEEKGFILKSVDTSKSQESVGGLDKSTVRVDLRPKRETNSPFKTVVSSVAERIFQSRFAPSEEHRESEEEKKDGEWQVVRSRKMRSQQSVDSDTPDKAGQDGSSVGKQVENVQAAKMPVPRKHKKKPKRAPQQEHASEHSDQAPEGVNLSSPKLSAKSKKKKRKRNTSSVSSDEGSQNSDACMDKPGSQSSSVSSRKSKKKKPQKLDIKSSTSDEKGKSTSESLTSSDSDGQKSGRSKRLKSFTPPVMGPDEDPVFALYSLTEAERKEKIKASLLRQVEGRKSVHSAPSTPTVAHIEETFGPPLLGCDPQTSPVAALYIPLDRDGLVSLPNVNVPKEVHTSLHAALLVWLLSGFATGSVVVSSEESGPRRVKDDSMSELDVETMLVGGDSTSDLPQTEPVRMSVTSIIQTVDRGHPLIVCGIGGSDVADVTAFCSTVLSHLKTVTFSHIYTILGLKKSLEEAHTEAPRESIHSLSPFADKVVLLADCGILMKPVAFHWYCPPDLGKPSALQSMQPLQSTVVTLQPHMLRRYHFVFSLLLRIHNEALDMAGFRTVYAPHKDQHTLAVALRGQGVLMKWLDIAGPTDPTLAVVTDPDSLNAKFGVHGQELFGYVSSSFYADAALAKWFGGRCNVQDRTIEGITDPQTKSERRKRQKVRFSDESYSESPATPDGDLAMPSPLYTLQVFPVQEVVLAVSPFVPSTLYSCILREVSKCGYGVVDVRRTRISYKKAQNLGFPPSHIEHFAVRSNAKSESPTSPLQSSTPQLVDGLPSPPTLLLTLQRENGERFINVLVDAVVAVLQSSSVFSNPLLKDSVQSLIHGCVHVDSIASMLGDTPLSPTKPLFGFVSFLPQSALPASHEHDLVFVAITSCKALPVVAQVLDALLLCDSVEAKDCGGFEFLGFKWIHNISRYQAKLLLEYSKCESVLTVDHLTNISAFAIACRAYTGYKRLEEIKPLFVTSDSDSHVKDTTTEIKIFHSKSSQAAFASLCLFFTDKELFMDPTKYSLLSYLPPLKAQPQFGILSGFNQTKPLLTSILSVAISNLALFLKVFDKVCRNEFRLVGAKVVLTCRQGTAPKSIALALQKENGVWCLEQDMIPFVKSSESYRNALNWSRTFQEAMMDVQYHFPHGLCCDAESVPYFSQEYKSLCPCISEAPTLAETALQGSQSVSSMVETTCILLRRECLMDLSVVSCLLSGLHLLQFEVVDVHMVTISKVKAEELSSLFSKSKHNSLSQTLHGSCLTVVLRRSNAASCFSSLVKSHSDKGFQDALKFVCAPESEQEVHRVVSILSRGLNSEE